MIIFLCVCANDHTPTYNDASMFIAIKKYFFIIKNKKYTFISLKLQSIKCNYNQFSVIAIYFTEGCSTCLQW